MQRISKMKYYNLLRNIFKFEIFYKVIVLFCLSPILRWILQRYLHYVSIGIIFNQDMFYQFFTWHGFLMLLFMFVCIVFIVYYEFYVVMNIVMLERQKESYALRKLMLKCFVNLKSFISPSVLLSGLYLILLLPFIHVGFLNSYISKWEIPHFIFNDLRLTVRGQLLICIAYVIFYGLYFIMLFVPVYLYLKKQRFIKATRSSLHLWKKIKMQEKLTLLAMILVWIVIDFLATQYLPYQILSNRDFSFYFLKYFVMSTAFRNSVCQYALVWLLSVFAMIFFLKYIITLANRYDTGFITVQQMPINTDRMSQLFHRCENFIQRIYQKLKKKIDSSEFYQHNKIATHIVIIGIVLCLLAFYFNQEAFVHQPWVIGHRGSAYEVENTFEAVKSAAECQADYAEIDIQLSKDGVPVVFHDSTLSRLSDVNDKVSDLTVAQLKQVVLSQNDKEASIVTLEELLIKMSNENLSIRLLVELKASENADQLISQTIEVVENQQMVTQCIFMSSDIYIVQSLQSLRPNWWIGYCIYGSVGDIGDSIWEMNIDFLAMEESYASTTFIQRAVSQMLPVYLWTVNDSKRMQQYLNMGVSGIITDYPDTGRTLIDQYLATSHQNYYYDEDHAMSTY